MRELLIVLDGMENYQYKYLKSLKNIEPAGRKNNTPIGMETDSLNCIMNLLGYEKAQIPSGRSFLEASTLSIPFSENDLIFRGNSVVLENRRLVSSCGKNTALKIETADYFLWHLSDYKYIIVLKNKAEFLKSVRTFKPHQNLGAAVSDILPSAEKNVQDILREIIDKYYILPWGESVLEKIPSFYELTGKTGAVIAKAEIVTGIAKAAEMYLPDLKKATADTDTCLSEKTECVLDAAKKYDFTMLHINGTDESSHRKNLDEKIEFIKKIDKEVLEVLLADGGIEKDVKIKITADHETDAVNGNHINSETDYFCFPFEN